jgi:hypothetical protein
MLRRRMRASAAGEAATGVAAGAGCFEAPNDDFAPALDPELEVARPNFEAADDAVLLAGAGAAALRGMVAMTAFPSGALGNEGSALTSTAVAVTADTTPGLHAPLVSCTQTDSPTAADPRA